MQLLGSQSMEQRNTQIEAFSNDPDVRVFLMSLKAGGVALNLTAASHCFLMVCWGDGAFDFLLEGMHACAPGRPAPTTVSSGHGLGGDWYIFGSSLCKSLGVSPSSHVLTHASTKTMVPTSPNRTPGGTQPANGKHLTGSTGWGERLLQEDGVYEQGWS